MADRVLVVAAHPDDEVLGCGGTSARHAAAGDDVHVLVLAEGATSRDLARQATERSAEISALRDAAAAAAETLGTRAPRFAGLPDNRLDGHDLLDVVKIVEAVVADLRPSIVYCHHGGDLNVDHRIVHQAVVTACRPLPGAPVRRLLAFETPSSTEWSTTATGPAFRPACFVDISRHLDRKLAALRCYAAEMRAFPHARSLEAVEALARVRGAAAGVAAAEAFEPVRELIADA
ncbi:MAG: PIG-L deacetylase family protein [Kiloniellales bacterium]